MADPPLVGLDPAFDGVLRRDPRDPTRCEYFQDRNKRWPFHCDDDGYGLLSRLLVVATPVVAATQAKIESTHGPSAHQIVAEGQQIYAKKPNMGQEDVTWSQREYGHLGLQKEYLRYKSVQRLTEAWACLQRARNAGVFASLREGLHDGDRQTLRWASLGGGPGFELLAVRWFFERHYPSYDLDLVSLDLEGSWRPCAEGLGLRFNEWDVNDGDGLERAAGGRVDFSIASYVLKMYMANEACARWLGAKLNALHDPMRAVLVVSRDENLEAACRLMREHGRVDVVPLMDPSGGRDDRQLVFVPAGFRTQAGSSGIRAGAEERLTFPNVPYEEHKKRRTQRDGVHRRGGGGGGGRRGGGGGGGGWGGGGHWNSRGNGGGGWNQAGSRGGGGGGGSAPGGGDRGKRW